MDGILDSYIDGEYLVIKTLDNKMYRIKVEVV